MNNDLHKGSLGGSLVADSAGAVQSVEGKLGSDSPTVVSVALDSVALDSVVLDNPSLDNPVTVRPVTTSDQQAWGHFVNTHHRAGVFHDWRWLPLLEQVFGHTNRSLIAWEGDEVVGVLPLMEVRTLLFGHNLVSLPFCQWAGALARDQSAETALRKAAITLAGSLRVSHLEWRNTEPSASGLPTQSELYVCFRKAISSDDETNLKGIPRKQRAMVRKGISNELSATDCSAEAFHTLYADNVHRHGTPCAPLSFFQAIHSAFANDCEFLMVQDSDGTPLSSVLTLYWRDEVFPFYAGDTPQARYRAANDFKYWEVMRRGAARGCSVFNYGRSKRGTGSFDFKRNWGFEPEPLHYEYWMAQGEALPALNPSNPKFRLMIETWRRLPRPVVNFLGPRLIRGLG